MDAINPETVGIHPKRNQGNVKPLPVREPNELKAVVIHPRTKKWNMRSVKANRRKKTKTVEIQSKSKPRNVKHPATIHSVTQKSSCDENYYQVLTVVDGKKDDTDDDKSVSGGQAHNETVRSTEGCREQKERLQVTRKTNLNGQTGQQLFTADTWVQRVWNGPVDIIPEQELENKHAVVRQRSTGRSTDPTKPN